MASFNRIILMGNLTRDPDYKQLASGQAVCRLGLASNRQFKNKSTGQMTQEVCFVDVDVWGAQAESCNQYLQKGRPVLIEGRLKLDTWQEADGAKRSKHSIVADRVTFLGGANDQETLEGSDNNSSSIVAEPLHTTSEKKPAFKSKAFETVTSNTENTTVSGASKASKKKDAEKPAEDNFGEIDLKNSDPFEDDLPF